VHMGGWRLCGRAKWMVMQQWQIGSRAVFQAGKRVSEGGLVGAYPGALFAWLRMKPARCDCAPALQMKGDAAGRHQIEPAPLVAAALAHMKFAGAALEAAC
jgi:hypothetical protein